MPDNEGVSTLPASGKVVEWKETGLPQAGRTRAMRTHQEIDKRSLALHRLVADKIRRDPALFDRVRGTLARWRVQVSPSAQPYLEEWERLVERGMESCLKVATEDSQRATALRQSSPFTGVLTNQERSAFLRTWGHRESQGA